MRGFLKTVGGLLLSLLIIGVFLLVILTVGSAVENHRDATTTIEKATVLSKERVSGGRRHLTSFYLTIQEQEKGEPTRVKVTMGAFTLCKEGSFYSDYPGTPGRCEVDLPELEIPKYSPDLYKLSTPSKAIPTPLPQS